MTTTTSPPLDLTTLPGPYPTTTSPMIFSSPSYNLPQIRTLHKSLHHAIDDKSSRLRTQVGGSYRELLGTADTIVAMKSEIEAVHQTLSDMGYKCGRGVVGHKMDALGKFTSTTMGDKAASGRERLLAGCLGQLDAILRVREKAKRGERLETGARLFVLGRLLLAAAAGGQQQGSDEKEMGRRRRVLEKGHKIRLMGGIDADLRRYHKPGTGDKQQREAALVRALSAYALATSSGARDVLGYFLRVRGEAIALALEVDEEERVARNPEDVIRALGLYTQTLQDVQALVPGKLADALMRLKREKLLENEELLKMEGLRLDVYKRWCGDEIQFYTPFIRHDDLDGKAAREMLFGWADKGRKVVLEGLENTLKEMGEFKAIVELRTEVLKLWISEGGKARGFDPSEVLDEIREAVNKHMLRVLEQKVAKLRLVGSEVSAAVEAWKEGRSDQHESLWDMDSYDTDLSNGAAQFTQHVVSRLYGRNDDVSKAVASYKSWFRVIDDVGTVVDQLKRQRWDNDVDEIEDEETIEERQQLLAKDDPAALGKHLNESLVKSFKKLDENLSTLWKEQQDSPDRGHIAMYFLRVLRDIRSRLPENAEVKGFGLEAVPSLHQALVSTVVISPLDELATVALVRRTVVGRSVWEGEPALPSSPSPGAFKFLRNLVGAMGDAGVDLWSPTAVSVLKETLRKQLSEVWLETVSKLTEGLEPEVQTETEETPKPEAEEGTSDTSDPKEESLEREAAKTEAVPDIVRHRDLLVQWLYDIYYLSSFLGTDDTFKQLSDVVLSKTDLEHSATAKQRLQKTSQDYFKRTSLLFGLLSS
ncbi:uncharacterized protein PODANS_7_5430 [Podospora anserina S mat+]|uniref:Conserved oligomeric Golgi complex subunit 1 n=1 Tax=Podospora anserina (strain S / ATCC MYA-4624 / DSM 980 / FGSC 10383) TaxID=515849 RepID=B2AVZ7_PODAN|nr:uncharacterized protein PODANS_7_5430 [Podospora anserina S mat+]CAP68571.1 unnamed protein product [Podospora anserina S mat+]CDP32045.1 Putative protein of unknown function [Podospora anserina S mat+]